MRSTTNQSFKNYLCFTFLLLLVIIPIINKQDSLAQERLSFRTLLNHASELSTHQIILLGVIENITTKQNASGDTYYEIDIFRDITVIVDDPVMLKNKPKHGDLLEIKGVFYDFQKYYGTLYNNLIVATHLKKLESS